MSFPLKAVLGAFVLALVAACAQNDASGVEEFVIVDPAPVTAEPTFGGKYN